MPTKTHRNKKWPPKVHIYVYDEDMILVKESRDSKFDLHDSLMQTWSFDYRRVHLGMVTQSKNWIIWEEASISYIEDLIRYDLNFDGNTVGICRITTETAQSCSQEFVWQLNIYN
jgi:hypothetical protein